MLKFITRFFAVIGFVAVALIALIIFLGSYMQEKIEPEPDNVVLTLDLDSPIVEQNAASPFSLAMPGDSVPLLDILRAIDHAAKDPHVKGIAARFGTGQPGLAQAQEIRAALAHFGESHKFTYAFGTDFGEFGLGDRAYYLASAFDGLWLQPVGTVSLTGVAINSPFAKQALDKIGVTADFMQREEYKSLMEPAQRDNSFSPPVRAEMQIMIDDLSDQIASGIAVSRKWELPHAKEIMAQGPYTDEEALQAGLVTKLGYADEFDDMLDDKAGKDSKQVDVETYLGYGEGHGAAKDSAKIALIYGTGLITERDSGGDGLAGDHVMGADSIATAFDDATSDKDVKAILFRVDSPGGSPAASETIRRAVMHAEKKGKPVIVSMGEVAASGGYWIAMNGTKIIADPATLTGSIGVVAGKFAADGLLQKAGVSMDRLSTAENAGIWDMTRGFTPPQRARVDALLDNTYHAFVANVAAARNIPMEKMPDIAKGRVWTGDQAIKIGLVDALGGYSVAMDETRKALKLEPDAPVDLVIYPAPPTPAERLVKLLHRFGSESAAMAGGASALAKMQSILAPFLNLAAGSDHPVNARMQNMDGFHE
ncbi:MAG: signal peptide peptidase SppA [Alphaproteobacteria bacterium]|nr:signal peptide peptidase SppA [Alphaproteobacteria bacterium]